MSEIITETARHTSKAKLPPKQKKRKTGGDRGPVPERTAGIVYLTPAAAAASLGFSLAHFNRLRLQGKIVLKAYRFYEGALPRYREDEVEALKAGSGE